MDLFRRIAGLSRELDLPFLVIGGHAVNAYGYSRTTLDVDFLITVESFKKWRPALESLGYVWMGQSENFAHLDPPKTDPPSLPVDLMFVSGDTFEKIYSEKNDLEFGDTTLPVPKPTHLIALKLHALRNPDRLKQGKDLSDIMNLISICEIDTSGEDFTALLERHANDETRRLLHAFLYKGK